MKLDEIKFTFEEAVITWFFSHEVAPNYFVEIVRHDIRCTIQTSKQPTVNNARKFATEPKEIILKGKRDISKL